MLTDVGGDVLAHGHEAGLGSPLADAVCLAAAPRLAERGIAQLLALFGAGCDGELTPAEVAERVAEVAAAGGYLGAWGPGTAELERLEAALAQIPTEASTMALRCARGVVGTAPIRDGRRTVQLTVAGGLVFFFDPLVALRSAARCAQLVGARGVAGGGQRDPARRGHRDRARLGIRAAAARRARLTPPTQMNGSVRRVVSPRTVIAGLAAAASLACVAPAPAAAQVQAYRTNDYGGFRDVLPPGTNGRSNLVELAAFLATGARPSHNDDQRDMYARLLSATPGVTAGNLDSLFKDCELRHRPGRPGARVLADRRADDHARQRARRPARLRRDARRRRCSASATRAPRTGCSSWTPCATPAAPS